MAIFRRAAANEKGAVLITTLLILALLTLIGISATGTSDTELKIAGSDRDYNVALYHTDAGLIAATKVINQVFFDRELSTTGGIVFDPDVDTAFEQIKYSDGYDNGAPDLFYTLDGTTVALDIHPWATRTEQGGVALEFITGNQSIAAGGGGGGEKYFRIEANGQSRQGVTPRLSVNYRRPGINNAGGY